MGGAPLGGATPPGKFSLATKILFGLAFGLAAGVICNSALGPKNSYVLWIADNIANTAGQIFLRLLFMVVIPLVFCSLALGVAGLGNLRNLGRVGTKTLIFFLVTTFVAAVLGLLLVNWIRPGEHINPETAMAIKAEFQNEAQAKIEQGQQGAGFGIQTFLEIIPKYPVMAAAKGDMLAVIFFALMVGIASTLLPENKSKPFLAILDALNDICVVIIGFAMKFAPYGVAGLVFVVAAKFGIDILKSLAYFVGTTLLGLAIHEFIVISFILIVFCRVNPLTFFKRTRGLFVTAFSLSSSSATLPTTIRTAQEEFGVPKHVAGFVLPLGATMCMNGTALFEGVSILFLAQVSGIHLDLGTQVIVIVMAVLTAVGAAGVPGGSLPLLALVLAQVGIDPAMLAVILGVDRILDMSRTVVNVTGDLTSSIFVARSEGVLQVPDSTPSDPL
ncbi:MAG: dicarboxylate/amino acid:cation symporter [Planctomycetota bacterium]